MWVLVMCEHEKILRTTAQLSSNSNSRKVEHTIVCLSGSYICRVIYLNLTYFLLAGVQGEPKLIFVSTCPLSRLVCHAVRVCFFISCRAIVLFCCPSSLPLPPFFLFLPLSRRLCLLLCGTTLTFVVVMEHDGRSMGNCSFFLFVLLFRRPRGRCVVLCGTFLVVVDAVVVVGGDQMGQGKTFPRKTIRRLRRHRLMMPVSLPEQQTDR